MKDLGAAERQKEEVAKDEPAESCVVGDVSEDVDSSKVHLGKYSDQHDGPNKLFNVFDKKKMDFKSSLLRTIDLPLVLEASQADLSPERNKSPERSKSPEKKAALKAQNNPVNTVGVEKGRQFYTV